MAKGRMLLKNISTSKKLAELKTDSARLLYTWLLPHLDVEGRFSANSYVVKGYIFPRLDEMTPTKIDELLLDLEKIGLIILYEVNGDRYLQFTKFGEFQLLRKDREAKSEIPIPPVELRRNSGVAPGELRVKLSKDKLSKDKYAEGSADPSIPLLPPTKVFSLEESLLKIKANPSRHVQIIGLWIQSGPEQPPQNHEQLKSVIKRNLRAANLLKGYSDEDILNTIQELKKIDYLSKFTLETISKYIGQQKKPFKHKGFNPFH